MRPLPRPTRTMAVVLQLSQRAGPTIWPMRTTCLKPAESLGLLDAIRLADDTRRFRILSIEPPSSLQGTYRISLQSEDGLGTVLNCEPDELLTVWTREVACPYRPATALSLDANGPRVRRTELSPA